MTYDQKELNYDVLEATCEGNLTKIKSLLDEGADVNSRPFSRTLLNVASANGDVATVKYLVEREANINAKVAFGENKCCTSLHLAAQGGHLNTVKFLLDQGAKKDSKNIRGTTPLHLAAHRGHTDVVQLLLEHMDPKTRINYGKNKLTAIARTKKLLRWCPGPRIELTDRMIDEMIELHYKTYYGSLNSLYDGPLTKGKAPLNEGTDVNFKDRYGNTLLHKASFYGRIAVAKPLIKNGAEIDSKNRFNLSPLHIASSLGHLAIVKCLVEYGANVYLKVPLSDGTRVTPLDMAMCKGYLATTKFLIANGA